MTKNLLLAALVLSATALPASAVGLKGEYIEARSASVYAGACHFNGELTTAGREALLGLFAVEGEYAGQRLDGLTVFAVIAGEANLAESATARRSVIYYSAKATAGQRDALVQAIRAKAGKSLGEVVAVKPYQEKVEVRAASTVRFSGFTLEEPNRATFSLDVKQYPCKHCVMPAQTWYEPFAKADAVQVAQGVSTGFTEKALGVSWRQETADNVFMGTFTL